MRLFIGTFLSPSNQDFYGGLVGALVAQSGGVLRSTPANTAHLTYTFVGHGDDEVLARVLDAVTQVAGGHSQLPIRLGIPHLLSGGRAPRLVCAEVVEGRSELTRLADDICGAITKACPRLEVSLM